MAQDGEADFESRTQTTPPFHANETRWAGLAAVFATLVLVLGVVEFSPTGRIQIISRLERQYRNRKNQRGRRAASGANLTCFDDRSKR